MLVAMIKFCGNSTIYLLKRIFCQASPGNSALHLRVPCLYLTVPVEVFATEQVVRAPNYNNFPTTHRGFYITP